MMKSNKTILQTLRALVLGGACLLAAPSLAQSKFHVDLDYHYNLGLGEHYASGYTYSRSESKMGGGALRLGVRYDVAPQWSAGVGVGAEHYSGDDFNVLPVYATVRYKPLKNTPSAYVFADAGYCVGSESADLNPGFTGRLGVGYTWQLKRHFGLNFQVAYDLQQFRNIQTTYFDGSTAQGYYGHTSAVRHGLSLGVGVTF